MKGKKAKKQTVLKRTYFMSLIDGVFCTFVIKRPEAFQSSRLTGVRLWAPITLPTLCWKIWWRSRPLSNGMFTRWGKHETNLEYTSCTYIFNTFASCLLHRVNKHPITVVVVVVRLQTEDVGPATAAAYFPAGFTGSPAALAPAIDSVVTWTQVGGGTSVSAVATPQYVTATGAELFAPPPPPLPGSSVIVAAESAPSQVTHSISQSYPVYTIKLARRAGYMLAGRASSMFARCLLDRVNGVSVIHFIYWHHGAQHDSRIRTAASMTKQHWGR